jgi:hypothetical protein
MSGKERDPSCLTSGEACDNEPLEAADRRLRRLSSRSHRARAHRRPRETKRHRHRYQRHPLPVDQRSNRAGHRRPTRPAERDPPGGRALLLAARSLRPPRRRNRRPSDRNPEGRGADGRRHDRRRPPARPQAARSRPAELEARPRGHLRRPCRTPCARETGVIAVECPARSIRRACGKGILGLGDCWQA